MDHPGGTTSEGVGLLKEEVLVLPRRLFGVNLLDISFVECYSLVPSFTFLKK